ncbi:hypothetical protein RIF29_21354 [Crotalaria pallida]|uniref:DM2 domain-containing protein n=1 Tax=Crotalaria pallida TaxID=3830 RepID=A0AAN9F2U6_CROPI
MDFDAKVGSSSTKEINAQVVQQQMIKKRKERSNKIECIGWGSTYLFRFLESIGKDISKEMSRDDLTEIVIEYARKNNLFNSSKKNKIDFDDNLHSLFGWRRKFLTRRGISELLEKHLAVCIKESCDDDDVFYSNSENDTNEGTLALAKSDEEHNKKINVESQVEVKPRSCFVAIIPSNIKLVYLMRSLVENFLVKDPENFESKNNQPYSHSNLLLM